MKKSEILAKTVTFVQDRLKGEGTGHDWWHIERVLSNARAIMRTEKADRFVVDMALLLHDVGDRKVIHKPEDDYTIAERWLGKCEVPHDVAGRVMFIIRNMSFSASAGKRLEGAPKEFYIVQDADRLDALGAIGIARAFAFGGSRSRPLYDPSKKKQTFKTSEEYRKLNSSTIHHFHEKILHLQDLMNTKAAKRIAAKRHAYTEKYLEQFLKEWKGER
ncbi:MAG TPA: HD domain-containing protein [Candidatus Paceibacterota bacterium]|jgi:uncharacterized protein